MRKQFRFQSAERHSLGRRPAKSLTSLPLPPFILILFIFASRHRLLPGTGHSCPASRLGLLLKWGRSGLWLADMVPACKFSGQGSAKERSLPRTGKPHCGLFCMPILGRGNCNVLSLTISSLTTSSSEGLVDVRQAYMPGVRQQHCFEKPNTWQARRCVMSFLQQRGRGLAGTYT